MRCVSRCKRNANSRRSALIPSFRRCALKFDAIIAGIEVLPMREKQVAFSQPYRRELSGVVVTAKDAATGLPTCRVKSSPSSKVASTSVIYAINKKAFKPSPLATIATRWRR